MVDMGNIWDRTTAFIGEHARAVLPIALLALLLPTAVSNLVWGAAQRCDGTVSPLVAAIVSVVLVLPTLWAQLALTAVALMPGSGAAGAGREATGGFGRAVVAMLVVFAAFAVASIPLVLAMHAGGMAVVHTGCSAEPAAADGHPGWFVPLYGIALAIAAAFVSVRLTMLYPVVIAERRAVAAIGRAFRLSRGIVWKLIGVWLVFILVYAVAALAASTGLGTVFRLLAPNAGPFGVTTILVALLAAAVRTAFTVIVATFAALLYAAVTGAGAARTPR